MRHKDTDKKHSMFKVKLTKGRKNRYYLMYIVELLGAMHLSFLMSHFAHPIKMFVIMLVTPFKLKKI